METKVCKDCGRELPITSFKLSRWGHYVEVCTECAVKKAKANKIKKEICMKAEVEAQRAREQERAQILQTFLPCELMRELKRRGYEGTLTLKQEIDICNV